ncbi:hypothetical protein GOB92_29260 [Sinorhizobium meliloti]|nr:hypothetical protein [Sinorhizobium meliloti]
MSTRLPLAAPSAICATAAGKLLKIPQSREGPARDAWGARQACLFLLSRHADIYWALKAPGDVFRGPTP